jgi:hypothetical protein
MAKILMPGLTQEFCHAERSISEILHCVQNDSFSLKCVSPKCLNTKSYEYF